MDEVFLLGMTEAELIMVRNALHLALYHAATEEVPPLEALERRVSEHLRAIVADE